MSSRLELQCLKGKAAALATSWSLKVQKEGAGERDLGGAITSPRYCYCSWSITEKEWRTRGPGTVVWAPWGQSNHRFKGSSRKEEIAMADKYADLEIFILSGQSNMSGRGGIRTVIGKDGTPYKEWDRVVPVECAADPRSIVRFNKNKEWEEAQEPLHVDIDVGTLSFSYQCTHVSCSLLPSSLKQMICWMLISWEGPRHILAATLERQLAVTPVQSLVAAGNGKREEHLSLSEVQAMNAAVFVSGAQ